MELLREFWYRDPDGWTWHAPAGAVIDGASIPRVLWSLVGSPFVGDYRLASIVHDWACHTMYPGGWRAVHYMFYRACRAGGVGLIRAQVMYAAVNTFGPKHPTPVPTRGLVAEKLDFGVPQFEAAVAERESPNPQGEVLHELQRHLEASPRELSLEEIDHFMSSRIGSSNL